MTFGFARKFISRLESFLPIDPKINMAWVAEFNLESEIYCLCNKTLSRALYPAHADGARLHFTNLPYRF